MVTPYLLDRPMIARYLLERGQPGRDQVQVLETHPLAVPGAVAEQLHGNVGLTLTHGHLGE